jgi:hypothetical protein
MVKYEISRLDTILDQSRDMKEANNTAWKLNATQAGHRIKTMLEANAGNGDYWVIYAKYSWLIEANRETHSTKALQEAFYYKPNNPEVHIVQADYHFDKAREARGDDRQHPMMQGVETNTETDKFDQGKISQSSYEAALLDNLSDVRKAYIYFKLGNLEEQIFQQKTNAKKAWEAAVKLAPDSKTGKLAKQCLQI